MAKFPTYEQMAKDVAEKALDEILYNGKSIREWADLIVEQESKKGRWIPVSERLPEEDGFYLATLDGEICGEDKPFCGLAEFEKGKWIDDEKDYQCVIAWQSLPEPYQEANDD